MKEGHLNIKMGCGGKINSYRFIIKKVVITIQKRLIQHEK